MGKYGLKGPYSVYFTTLFRHPKGLTSAQLTELCGRDKAEVSRTISLLESKGLVIREAVGSSAYRALLRLTQEGFALAEVINQKAAMAVEMVSQGLPPEKRAVFYETLELITNNLQTLSKLLNRGLSSYERANSFCHIFTNLSTSFSISNYV